MLRESGSRAVALERMRAPRSWRRRSTGIEAALRELHSRDVQSIVIEGAQRCTRPSGTRSLPTTSNSLWRRTRSGEAAFRSTSRAFSTFALFDRRVEALGPDVIIEGYVHRPH